MNGKRIWYPFTFTARNARVYRVSFLVAEEATWDHRFHDLDGREIDGAILDLTLRRAALDPGELRWRRRFGLSRHRAAARLPADACRSGRCTRPRNAFARRRSPSKSLLQKKRCPRVASKDYAGAKSPPGRSASR